MKMPFLAQESAWDAEFDFKGSKWLELVGSTKTTGRGFPMPRIVVDD